MHSLFQRDNRTFLADVIKWKHFPRYWPFVRGIHRIPVNSPHKGQWRGALMFSLICVWINGWVNNREAGDLRRYRAHYDVSVICRGIATRDFFFLIWIDFHPVWITNHTPSKVWKEITYPFPNSTVGVCELKSNYIPHFIMGVITYKFWD